MGSNERPIGKACAAMKPAPTFSITCNYVNSYDKRRGSGSSESSKNCQFGTSRSHTDLLQICHNGSLKSKSFYDRESTPENSPNQRFRCLTLSVAASTKTKRELTLWSLGICRWDGTCLP